MKKYILGVVVAFSILVSPALVQAQTAGLNAGQIGAIIQLLQAFGANQSVIDNVRIALNGGIQTTACTQDAKVCPDGTAVGRIGPNCEFAACPTAPLSLRNFVAGSKLDCENLITATRMYSAYFGNPRSCVIGGGCGVSCGIPSATCVSANPTSWGVCLQAPSSDYTFWLTNLYRIFLGRTPDTAGLNFYLNLLTSGAKTEEQVHFAIAASPEAIQYAFLKDVYQTELGRVPNDSERAFYIPRLLAWESQTRITTEVQALPEAVQYRATHATAAGYTACAADPNAWYLNRYPDVKNELHYGTIANGGLTHFCDWGKSEGRENCFASNACETIASIRTPISDSVLFSDSVLSIKTNSLPSGTVGVDYSTYLESTEVCSYCTYSWLVTGLPPGLTFKSPETGGKMCRNFATITGRPTVFGNYKINIALTASGKSTSKEFDLVVDGPARTTRTCINDFCFGTNSILTDVKNAATPVQSNASIGAVCCDRAWWVDTRESNWYSACNGLGGLQSGGWYKCNSTTSTTASGLNQTASALDALNSVGSSSNFPSTDGFSYTWSHDLQIGSLYSADVRELQTTLTKEGVYTGEITGGFYNQTYTAVKVFQQKYGINATGYVGAITRAKLNALY